MNEWRVDVFMVRKVGEWKHEYIHWLVGLWVGEWMHGLKDR